MDIITIVLVIASLVFWFLDWTNTGILLMCSAALFQAVHTYVNVKRMLKKDDEEDNEE